MVFWLGVGTLIVVPVPACAPTFCGVPWNQVTEVIVPPLAFAVRVVPLALAVTVTVGQVVVTVMVAVLLFVTVPLQLVARRKTVVVLVGAKPLSVAVVCPLIGAFVPDGVPVNHCRVIGAVPATTAVMAEAVWPLLMVWEAGEGCEVNEAFVQTTPLP